MASSWASRTSGRRAASARNSGSALERAPIEIRQRILVFLPDSQSMQAAVLSGSAMHDAFNETRGMAVARVFLNEVDTPVLRLNDIAIRARAVPEDDKLEIMSFLEDHLVGGAQDPAIKYDSHVLKEMSALHRCVEELATHFAKWALAKAPGHPSRFTVPPSPAEKNRIQCAFYFYHIASTLLPAYPRTQSDDDDHSRVMCWACFSSSLAEWEQYQMCAVDNYLYEICSPAYIALASSHSCSPCKTSGEACWLYPEYAANAGVQKMYQLWKGTATRGSVRADLVTLSQSPLHNKRALGGDIMAGDDWGKVDLVETPFTKEDTDLGPELMFCWLAYGLDSEYLYEDKSFDNNWTSSWDIFWDLERMEGMSGGRCSMVQWDREQLGPRWPEWHGFDD